MIQIIRFILEIVEAIFTGLFESVFDFVKGIIRTERKIEYNADFIPSRELLSTYNKGFSLTGKKNISLELSYNHCLLIGSTSSGKSSRVLVPSILNLKGNASIVVNDPAGELFTLTSGALAEAGYIVKTLTYNVPERSEGYSPLHRAKTSSDIQKISKIIVVNALGVGKADPFWNISAEACITIFAKYLVQYAPKEYQTLHNVLHLVNTFAFAPEKIDRLMVRVDPILLSEYKALVSNGDKTLSSILSTCRAALSIFSDPAVATVTSYDTLDFEEFRNKKTALFINNSIPDMRYYSVISSIFFEQFFGALMRGIPSKNALPIFFLLDECSSLYMGASLGITISNLRKYRSGLLLAWQSYSQISDLYGVPQAKNIAANCYSKIYMSGQPLDVATELSTTLGSFEYRDEKDARRLRPLATPNEIMELKESIIRCGNNRAIKAKMVPYFEQYKLRRLTEILPYQPKNVLPFDTPPLIQFD